MTSILLLAITNLDLKKQSGCSHALYTLRCVVDYYVSFGTTINLCALDICKAFDRMNHHGLFVKLLIKRIPVNLLSVYT